MTNHFHLFLEVPQQSEDGNFGVASWESTISCNEDRAKVSQF